MSGLRDFLKVYWPLVVVALAGVLLALVLMDPAPPKNIRFAAGSPGGAYHAFAERYQRLLAEEGVEVEPMSDWCKAVLRRIAPAKNCGRLVGCFRNRSGFSFAVIFLRKVWETCAQAASLLGEMAQARVFWRWTCRQIMAGNGLRRRD